MKHIKFPLFLNITIYNYCNKRGGNLNNLPSPLNFGDLF